MTDSTPSTDGLPPLFEPLRLRSLSFKNRIFLAPMCQYACVEGYVSPWHLDHHARFALGGPGGALVESTGVTRDGRITRECLGIYRDDHVEGLAQIVNIYRRAGVPVGIQLSHSGRKGSTTTPAEGGQPLAKEAPAAAWQTIAPSAVPLKEDWPVPLEMDETMIQGVIDAFCEAAARAVRAGFDFIEIHGAHGYLLHSFMSPKSNLRTDRWGGDVEGRCRLPVEVARALRGVVPAEMPIFYRASAVDGLEDGLHIEDTIILARHLKAAGVDLMHISAGGITGASGRSYEEPHEGYLVPFAARIRAEADVPTMAVGLIFDPQMANEIVAEGRADAVALGRQMIADPSFPYHAAEALGHPDPASVFPPSYAGVLRRWPGSAAQRDARGKS
jgi:2,4-dienoyl-CoA reductase-like NADH-dependent reductase (Old Yellow Enzyme family)